MDPDVGRLVLFDDFDLAVCPIVLAVGALEDEAAALGEAPLKGCLRLLLNDVIGVALRQGVEMFHVISHPLFPPRDEGEVGEARFRGQLQPILVEIGQVGVF